MSKYTSLAFLSFLAPTFMAMATSVKDGYGSVSQIRAISGATLIQVVEGTELNHADCTQENWDDGNKVVWAIDSADANMVSVTLAAFAAGKSLRVLGDSNVRIGSYCKVSQVSVKP